MALQQSLSVVLAVYNAEQFLTENVHKLLDILPDLTHRFEIVVVDDGSLDQTAEIAHELSREYPQVQLVQHGRRLGWSGILETALQRTWGEVLFVQDQGVPIDSSQFQRLWALRARDSILLPTHESGTQPSLMKRLAAWGVRLDEVNKQGKPGGLQMIRREPNLISSEHRSTSDSGKMARISRTDGPQLRANLPARDLGRKSVNYEGRTL